MEQHMQALQQANFVRQARAELKRAVKAREVLVAEVLRGEIPDWLEGMQLEELCNAIPRFRWRTFQRLLQANQIRLTAVVGDLTERKRKALGADLAEWEMAAETRRARRHQRTSGASARARAAAT